MSNTTIGIIGGGQLGSMLSAAAKNLNRIHPGVRATGKYYEILDHVSFLINY